MAYCPFMSHVTENGGIKHEGCIVSCALRLNGHCSFQILAAKAWKEAEFKIPQKNQSSQSE